MEVILHKNDWPWGMTVNVITAGGAAMVEMSFDNVNVGVCWLSGLSVIPERRREGLATYLLKYCERYCKKQGIFRIDLNSVNTESVIGMYKKLGYTEAGDDDGFRRMYKLLK